jgi:GT2 family glycosyltransferase
MSSEINVFPLVSIITINYNQLSITKELLESLKKCEYPNFEVIVVDNASKEDPIDELKKTSPNVNVIRSEINLGFAGGNNLGYRYSKGDYIFFLNNDTEIDTKCINTVIDFMQSKPEAGICSPLIVFHNSNNLIQYAGSTGINPFTGRNKRLGFNEKDTDQYKEPFKTSFAHGAGMMVPKSVIEAVGQMPEVFFLYYEELDWCEMIRRSNYSIYVIPRAKVYHKESISIGKESPFKTYFVNRNRLLFMRRNSNGVRLVFFYIFFSLIVLPKKAIMFLFEGKKEHAKVLFEGFLWNLSHTKAGVKRTLFSD